MTKYLFTIILCLATGTGIHAQRLLKGQKGFEATVGLISDKKPWNNNFFVQAGLTVNGKDGSYQLYAVEYSRKMHAFQSFEIPVETYIVEGGYSFPLLRDWGKNISLNMGFTAVAGYEVFNKSSAVLSNGAVIQNADSFIYGAGLRLSVETYLTDHFLILIQGKCKAIWGTSVEHFRPSTGVGLRYIF
ncbi:conjugal transfer protein TraO [Pedobacter sp. ISL-68]|uniref:conjugal transfer protein TraO n=1 Tax=unclassified Pedobacter TaxID=2628915 RepID=UPI001BE7619A|nr:MULTISPECIES: conjugal transfer protein TraO [unclassified Pedobacter]MBT2559822.1 conjugal transfer protein TraO [Pedobacter sp. ISL-64]MBT2592127.1 conjugal transfer protein TraO [Pedobacter sp. ISL-68]